MRATIDHLSRLVRRELRVGFTVYRDVMGRFQD